MVQQITEVEGARTFINGEAARIEAYRRVKVKSGTTTTPPEVVYADAGEAAIGFRRASFSSVFSVYRKPTAGRLFIGIRRVSQAVA